MRAAKTGAKALGALACLAICLSAAAAQAANDLPKPIRQNPPSYPKAAEELHIEGWVRLEFDVDGKGNVIAPRVVNSTPPGVFDAAALRAVSMWKFQALGKETDNVHIKVRFKDH